MAGPTAQLLAGDPSELSAAPNGQADTEIRLAEVLAELVGSQSVASDQHFFDDLGADSMVMARFCARVRKRADLPSVSMTDIYRHPTIRSLALALTDVADAPIQPAAPPSIPVPPRLSTRQYLVCGTLQLLIFLGYSYLGAFVAFQGSQWISVGAGPLQDYLRSVLVGGAGFLGLCLLPIVAKWILVGRWKPRQIRIWSLAYVRFWTVKTLIRSNPLVLFVGSPLYVFYLRALGARIGRGVAIFSRNVPVCTDLLAIGDGTVIRQDAFVSCYRAHSGVIETGPVTIGKDVFVGEATVIDIGTVLGDGAQLGRSSSLHAGQAIPAGESWHGSPARRADVDYRSVGPAACGTLRRVGYASGQLLTTLAVWVPLLIGGVTILFAAVPQLSALRVEPQAYTSWTFYADALAASFVLFFGAVLVGLLFVFTVPRVLSLFLKPGKVYSLYGFHYGIHRAIVRLTNVRFFNRIFGDSSAIVHYLRALGYDLSRVEQTGSNFGTEVKHEIPYLSSVGSGTMVADGLSIINTEFSSTSFRVSRVSIGPRNFLGNRIAYPPGGRTGENCLLATKVMVPITGAVREGVGLLGSPAFEIPRSVERDTRFDELKDPTALRRLLTAKNRHNAATAALFLLVRWIYVCGLLLLASLGMGFFDAYDVAAIALSFVLTPLYTACYFVLVERVETAYHALRPLYCSIYVRDFWRRERYWKVPAEIYLHAFNGTPFKNVIWRLLGVRMGRRIFDDGCYLTERALGSIGDDCTLNAGSVIQCHSQEDGTFKSDRTFVGAGCTLGVGAFVHYGVTVGDGAVLAPDSFLMKGEEVPQRARWGGNPARDLADAPDLPAPVTPRPAATAGNRVAKPMGIFLLATVPVVVLGLLFVAGMDRLVATAGEATLAAGVALPPGSAIGPLTWPDAFAVRQLAAIDSLLSLPTSQTVIDAARTASAAVSMVGWLLLWPVARRIGVSTRGAALAVGLSGLATLTSGLFGAVDAGALAALWLIVAAVLVGRSRTATLVGLVAALLAVLTVPLAAVVPLALAAHGLLARAVGAGLPRWLAGMIGVGLAAAAGYVVVRATGLGPPTTWWTDAGGWVGSGRGPVPPTLLLAFLAAGVLVVVPAWIRTPRLRPVATATVVLLTCAAIPGPHATTALLLALPALALQAAVVIDDLTAGSRWRPRAALTALTALLSATALVPIFAPLAPQAPLEPVFAPQASPAPMFAPQASLSAWALPQSAATPNPDRQRFTSWVKTELDPTTVLRVDPLTGAQLIRDGLPAERLLPANGPAVPGALLVVAARPGAPPAARPVGVQVLVTVPNGPGGAPTSVLLPQPGPDHSAIRRVVGSWLADNTALTLPPAAAEDLRSGQVDVRLATALAGLGAGHRLTITDFPTVPDEPADATRRVALVTEVDGKSTAVAGVAELAKQQLAGEPPSTRPASAAVEQGVLVVRYTVPSAADR